MHILPGIDDGARNMEEALSMARQYVKVGFRHVLATPHCVPGTKAIPKAELVKKAAALLISELEKASIALKVCTGMEVAMGAGIDQHLVQGQILALAKSNYVLLEPPFSSLPLNWQQVIFEIHSAGYQVLLAHPERCAQLAAEPEINRELINMGVYFQVTWGSFSGLFGTQVKRQAYFLAQQGWVHCLATDSHNDATRGPETAVANMDALRDFFGPENLSLLSLENPTRIMKSKSLINPVPVKAKAHKRWRWPWSRKVL